MTHNTTHAGLRHLISTVVRPRRSQGQLAFIVLGLSVTTANTAWAQTTTNGEAPTASDQLQEIVITAQRRTENLQNVSIAATVVEGSELQDKAINSIADMQFVTPSLSIGDSGLSNAVNIRGVGLASSNPNVVNGVATYYDGVFQPPIVTSNQFYDMADVEVLRGPQGTLVGSNSTGGAIFLNTQNPKIGQNEGYVQVGKGNYGETESQGAINLPVNDILAFRVAGEYKSRDSFYTSVGPVYTDAGSLNEKAGRFGMLFKPGSFQALLKVEYTDRNTGGYANTPIPGTQYAPYAPTNPFELAYDTPNENHERGLLSSLELRYELPDGITLRSMSGYQDKNIHNLIDQSGAPVNTAADPSVFWDQKVRQRVWTEEINVLSRADDDFNWVLGGYGQRDKIDVNILGTGDTGLGGPNLYIFVPQNKTTTGWFGQVNFNVAPHWQLQVGARYSTFRVDGSGYTSIILPFPSSDCEAFAHLPNEPVGCGVGSNAGSESDGRPTGKIALNYTPDANNLYYAFVARGYKSGGFNSPTSVFGPETVMDYELGWKSTALDGHLRTQLDGFYYSYKDFQFQELNLTNGSSGVENLPTSTIKGIEASTQALLNGWQLDGGLSYLRSNLPSPGPFVNTHLLPTGATGGQCGQFGNAAAPPGCFDYTPYLQTGSGGVNLFSPEWTVNVGLQYTANLGPDISLTPRVNFAYVTGQFTSLTYSETTDYFPGHGLVSAQATLNLYKHWRVEAYGTNLANRVYRSGQEGLNGNYYVYGAPRQYGVRVAYSWD